MKRIVIIVLGLALTAGIAGGRGLSAARDRDQPGEYQVKAAFLVNVLQFVDWPAPGPSSPEQARFCVVGELPEPGAFDELRGEFLLGKPLQIRRAPPIEELRACQVVFIGASEDRRLAKILATLRGSGALTVGDTAGYAERGVVVNFYTEDRKIRFEINAGAARQAGLKISAKLMRLAGAVHNGAAEGE